MSTQHTSGPWVLNPIQPNQIATADAKLEIARATVLADHGETIANTRLIAAAPDLLAALELCEGNIASLAAAHPNIYSEWLAVVSAAIAKATELQGSAK